MKDRTTIILCRLSPGELWTSCPNFERNIPSGGPVFERDEHCIYYKKDHVCIKSKKQNLPEELFDI